MKAALVAADACRNDDIGPIASANVPSSTALSVRDLSSLVRPRIAVMVLVTVVAAMGLTVAGDVGEFSRPTPVGWNVVLLLLGTAVVAASSSIANQVLERRTDRLMPRTAGRPVAAGRMTVSNALLLTGFTLILGSWLILVSGGMWASVAAVATWLLYVAIYTPLKRVTPLNTAVGAVAGALPVAIGWCAADGPARLAAGDYATTLAVGGLATVLYLWQFPHFMAIAWLYRSQYERAGLRMLTTVDPTGLRAAGQSLAASLAMVPASLVLAVPSGNPRLFFAATILPVAYVTATVHFALRRDDPSARRLLLASIGTLLGLLVACMLLGGRIDYAV